MPHNVLVVVVVAVATVVVGCHFCCIEIYFKAISCSLRATSPSAITAKDEDIKPRTRHHTYDMYADTHTDTRIYNDSL